MPKLHTHNHDIPALEQRLKEVLEGQAQRTVTYSSKPKFTNRLIRRFAALGPVPRRIVNGCKAWKLAGYSPRWLLLKMPLVRPIGRRVKARLQFRRVVVSHLQRLDDQLRQLNHQHVADRKQLENTIRENREML